MVSSLLLIGLFDFEPIKVRQDTEKAKKRPSNYLLIQFSLYPGLYLQKEEEGKNFCYIHLHVEDIEFSLLDICGRNYCPKRK